MCLCQSNMKAPTVLQSKNRAEKALFVFAPFNRQDSSIKWPTVVLLCECMCACFPKPSVGSCNTLLLTGRADDRLWAHLKKADVVGMNGTRASCTLGIKNNGLFLFAFYLFLIRAWNPSCTCGQPLSSARNLNLLSTIHWGQTEGIVSLS